MYFIHQSAHLRKVLFKPKIIRGKGWDRTELRETSTHNKTHRLKAKRAKIPNCLFTGFSRSSSLMSYHNYTVKRSRSKARIRLGEFTQRFFFFYKHSKLVVP